MLANRRQSVLEYELWSMRNFIFKASIPLNLVS
jgi:hypothetical protein